MDIDTEQSSTQMDEEADLYLKQLEQLASEVRENDSDTEEPPAKRAKTDHIQIIAKAPVLLNDEQSPITDLMIENMIGFHHGPDPRGHTLAPLIPLVSEVPLPVGYTPARTPSNGITAGRPLAQITNTNFHMRNSVQNRITPQTNAPVLPRTNPAIGVTYHLKQAGDEWSDVTLSEWDPSPFFLFLINFFSKLYLISCRFR